MKLFVTAALTAAVALTATPAMADLALAKKSNCMACHTQKTNLVGPSFENVAKKYAGDKKAQERLVERVIKGTSATGGEVWKLGSAMPPNAVKPDVAAKLVTWILAGGK